MHLPPPVSLFIPLFALYVDLQRTLHSQPVFSILLVSCVRSHVRVCGRAPMRRGIACMEDRPHVWTAAGVNVRAFAPSRASVWVRRSAHPSRAVGSAGVFASSLLPLVPMVFRRRCLPSTVPDPALPSPPFLSPLSPLCMTEMQCPPRSPPPSWRAFPLSTVRSASHRLSWLGLVKQRMPPKPRPDSTGPRNVFPSRTDSPRCTLTSPSLRSHGMSSPVFGGRGTQPGPPKYRPPLRAMARVNPRGVAPPPPANLTRVNNAGGGT